MAVAPKMLRWQEDLSQLTPINRWIFKIIAAGMMFVVIGTGVVVIFSSEELVSGGRLALSFSGFMTALWIFRGSVQIFLYSKIWPDGWRGKISHYSLCALFVFLAGVYGAAFIYNWRNQ